MNQLFICEKPTAAKALAAILSRRSPQKPSTEREVIRGGDWTICMASGHIYEMVEPDHYLTRRYPDARRVPTTGKVAWDLAHLPLMPRGDEWALVVAKGKASMVAVIRKELAKADSVVHAGDSDREGQLVVDEILSELGYRKPVQRVMLAALDPDSVSKAVAAICDNAKYRGMRDAALARQRADWLAGMNFSRQVTLLAKAGGFNAHVSIGRVQTPVLGLIVARDREIAGFKPVDFWDLHATIEVQAGKFKAKWQPRKDQPGLDAEGRLLNPAIGQQIKALVSGQAGVISDYSDAEKTRNAPLPFSMGKLQIFASKRYGMSADKVLSTVQSLYDAGLVTYPRTDSQYLPQSQHADAPAVVRAAADGLGVAEPQATRLDAARKSAAFNDKKVSAHHAIVPTSVSIRGKALDADARRLYEDIALRYLAQFMPPQRYRAVAATATVQGEAFRATGSTTLDPGWKGLYGATLADEPEPDEADEGTILPPMKKGDAARCAGLEAVAKKTTPPSHFDEGTLIEAMINIHKYVTDPKVKAILEQLFREATNPEEAGLGTPATRHTFMRRLLDIGVITTRADGKGKQKRECYIATDLGKALVGALDRELTAPDMTALWETVFGQIEAGKTTLSAFMDLQERWLRQTMDRLTTAGVTLPAVARPAFGGGASRPRAAAPVPARARAAGGASKARTYK